MLLETDKKILGEKIKQYRKKLGLTQFQLAELVDLHERQISRIEIGLNYPTYTTFAKLIEVLNINISDFLIDSNSTINPQQNELIKFTNKSSDSELKMYIDVLKAIKKNLPSVKE